VPGAAEQEQGNCPNRIQKAAQRKILLPEESEIRSLESASGKKLLGGFKRDIYDLAAECRHPRCETNSIWKQQKGKRQRATSLK
jgi:hypothetical protein